MKELTLPNGMRIFYIDKLTAIYIYNEIYVDRIYLPPEFSIHDGDIVFDIGANIGMFSRFIADQAKNLQIFAFEPVPQIIQVLKKNIVNLSANLNLYEIGLSDRTETIEFDFYPNVSGDSSGEPLDWDYKIDKYLENYEKVFVNEAKYLKLVPKRFRKRVVGAILKSIYRSKKVMCNLRPTSEIIRENHLSKIDLMKIDAENYEKHVLAGITDEDWPKIRQITIEVHTHIKNGRNLLNECITLLQNKGFRTFLGKESQETILGVFMLYGIRS